MTDYILGVFAEFCGDLFRSEIAAESIIHWRFFGGFTGGTHFIEAFFIAEAIVSTAFFDEFFGVFCIGVTALGLDIWAVISADIGAFIPLKACIFEGVIDDFEGTIDSTFLIGIFDAEDESAVHIAGEEIGEEGGAEVSNVHIAGGAGGETSSHHGYLLLLVGCFLVVGFLVGVLAGFLGVGLVAVLVVVLRGDLVAGLAGSLAGGLCVFRTGLLSWHFWKKVSSRISC